MRKVITQSEYEHFLAYGKFLPFLYGQYLNANQPIQEIEQNKAEIEQWISEDYTRYIASCIKKTLVTKKRIIPSHLYLDFIKIIKYAYRLDYMLQNKLDKEFDE